MPIFNLWTHSMCPYRFFYSSRLALGIGAASFASGIQERGKGIWGRGRDSGTGTGFGDGESEQRYSGKPDGFAGTPKVNS